MLSLEEAIDLHVRLSGPVSRAFDLGGGALREAWVVPAGLGLVALGALLLPFLSRLPRHLAARLLLAAALYIGGAVGFEIIGQAIFVTSGAGVLSGLANLVEETLEPAAVLLLIHALGRHLSEITAPAEFRLTFAAPTPRA